MQPRPIAETRRPPRPRPRSIMTAPFPAAPGRRRADVSIGPPDQPRLLGRPERDVGLGIEEQLVAGELQAERDDERRLVEADLRRESVIPGPGAAGGRRLLGEPSIGQATLPPR